MSCFPRLRTLAISSLRSANSAQTVSTSHCRQHKISNHLYRLISNNAQISSSRQLPSPKNIVFSRHENCFLHNQTAVQRFFERASLWPNLVALVKQLEYYPII